MFYIKYEKLKKLRSTSIILLSLSFTYSFVSL